MLASRFEPRAAPVALTGRRRPLLGPPGRPPGPSGRRREAGGGPPQCRPGAGRLGRVRFAGGSPAHGAAAAATSPLRRLAPLGLAAAAMAGGRRHRSRPIAGRTAQARQSTGGERPRRGAVDLSRGLHRSGPLVPRPGGAGRVAPGRQVYHGHGGSRRRTGRAHVLAGGKGPRRPLRGRPSRSAGQPGRDGRGCPPLRLERPALRVVGGQPGAPQGGRDPGDGHGPAGPGAGAGDGPAPALVLAGYPGWQNSALLPAPELARLGPGSALSGG